MLDIGGLLIDEVNDGRGIIAPGAGHGDVNLVRSNCRSSIGGRNIGRPTQIQGQITWRRVMVRRRARCNIGIRTQR